MKTIRCTDDEIQIVFVTNYYNIELSGLCRCEGKLYSFEIDKDFDLSSDDPVRYILTPLTTIQKVKRLFGKRLFELCVGTHWSFDKNGQMVQPWRGYRRPKWLYRLLYNLYYRGYYKKHPELRQFNRH